MPAVGILLVLYLSVLCDTRVVLYDTENITLLSEKFDCVYVFDNVNSDYGGSSAGKISYCRRPNINEDFTRSTTKCENGGQLKYFAELLEGNVRPFEVLEWSSSVEMADKYAVFYHSNYSVIESDKKQDFLCRCIHPNTFGKYCEYQLTHEANSFEASQILQAYNRFVNPFDHQRVGDIVCYETLRCNSGLLCLDWRDICDNDQQCEDGWDEENCDKLEFNECEENEFRCNSGMCIPEEYWLDGDQDCMDWSDENINDEYASWCFVEPATIDCDEHTCFSGAWSCGDGQCIEWKDRIVFQNALRQIIGCWNLRNMNYMCELTSLTRMWTRPNGLCHLLDNSYDDPQLSMDNVTLSNEDKCVYLIRCALSDSFELDCPCNRLNCSHVMSKVCGKGQTYSYPSSPLIRPYIRTEYDWTNDFEDKMPLLLVSGNVRCRGYHGSLWPSIRVTLTIDDVSYSRWDYLVCLDSAVIRNKSSSMKYDKDCWNNSLTFNGRPYAVHDVCEKSQQCISSYRINNGLWDCVDEEDEEYLVENKDLYTRVHRHRFQCSNEQPTYLPALRLGDRRSHCWNNYDEFLYGDGRPIVEITCRKSKLDNCELLKEYIKNSTLIFNSSENLYSHTHQLQYQWTNRIPFRSYCNTFWDIQGHMDEFRRYCRSWICHQDQYQCQTGQCIPLEWVCDKQWDYADASDEEAIFAVHQWSLHNKQLKSLNERREKCLRDYGNLPFSQICQVEKEFPCLRSNVSDPLNVTQNYPCIPYSKIGDDIVDCYNAYDEKNTFEFIDGRMLGFALQCGNQSLKYPVACLIDNHECVDILCPYLHHPFFNCSEPSDAVCIDDGRCVQGGRCNGEDDCLYGEDEYWCAPADYYEKLIYRYAKLKVSDNHPIFDRRIYPPIELETETFSLLPQSWVSTSIRTMKNSADSNRSYSFMCNKGVTVIMLDKIVCFCPPAYFGHKCQFFSDRITIVTHLDLTTWPAMWMVNSITSRPIPMLFKIKVNLLFNGSIVDHYEFHSNPSREMRNYIKHKFYLLYSRSSEMLSYKKARFYNRTDIESHHLYSVHFDIYVLYNNQSTPVALGSWHSPIYFDFLPSFRLATILRFPNWLGNSSFDLCTNHTCNQNSICQPIFNQNNLYFCSCKSGFYGENCSKYNNACNSYCSPHSLCRPDDRSILTNTNDPFCICSLGHFGPRCFLKYEQCDSNPCLNHGNCVYTYELYGGDSFECICSKFFYGDRCQKIKMAIEVRLNTSIIDPLPRASTIQFYDVDNSTLELILRHQQVTKRFPSSIYYAHALINAPALGVLKAYDDLNQPKYYIFYLRPKTSSINISSTPERCPHASTLFRKNDSFNIPDVFKYHYICKNDSQRFCFFDNEYLCICQWDNERVDCFMHDVRIDHCSKCLSNGKCVKGDIYDDNDFLCLCPRCYQGRLCEFNMQAFGFTLDSLLIDCSREMKFVYLSMVCLLFLVGFFDNLCSFVTFRRPTTRKVGVGNYLFIVTCLNQMSLLCLLIKFIQMTFGMTNIESCKTVSYLFSVFTRLTYWLTSWVTIDQLLSILFPTSVVLKNPRLAIWMSVVTSIGLFSMHIHEVMYYTNIQHLSTSSSICVTNFDTYAISTYNRVSTLIHYLLPFVIQIITITLLIILAARSRSKARSGNLTFQQVLIKQFRTQKELYITPITIILSSLPQTIFTFSLACTELTVWHRHTLLITYLLSYIPQVLGFILYVLPSTTYKKEFSQTLLAKRSMSWMFSKKTNTTTISKTKS